MLMINVIDVMMIMATEMAKWVLMWRLLQRAEVIFGASSAGCGRLEAHAVRPMMHDA
jgi:hypothetical protein